MHTADCDATGPVTPDRYRTRVHGSPEEGMLDKAAERQPLLDHLTHLTPA